MFCLFSRESIVFFLQKQYCVSNILIDVVFLNGTSKIDSFALFLDVIQCMKEDFSFHLHMSTIKPWTRHFLLDKRAAESLFFYDQIFFTSSMYNKLMYRERS